MSKIYYKKTNGQAHDVQRKKSPDLDDILYSGEEMPDIETLHDQSYITTRDAEIIQKGTDRQQLINDVNSMLSIPEIISVVKRLAEIVLK